MSFLYYQDIEDLKRKLRKIEKQICCRDCIELPDCTDGQIPVLNGGLWECGENGGVGAGHDPLTLELGLITQDSADLVGQELEFNEATDTTYGVMSPADKAKLDDVVLQDAVTLNADQPTQDSGHLVGQELRLSAATATAYGVVKLEDLFDTSDHVNTWADLPDPTLHQDETWIVLNSTGTQYWSWLLGGTWKPKGFYYSNGVFWDWIGAVPYQATQTDVDAGVVTDQFVSPATLSSAQTIVLSVAKSGEAEIKGDVTLSEGSNIILTQVGNDIEIASTGGGFDYPQVLFTQVFS